MEGNNSGGREPGPFPQTALRRPHNRVSVDISYAAAAASGGDNPHNSAPPSNSMPTSMSSNSGEFFSSVSRTDYPNYEFSSGAVNVPPMAQANSRLDPRVADTVKNSKLSPLAKEFVPKTFVQTEAPPPSGNAVPSQLEYMVCLMQEFIYEITLSPGKFDEEVILLTETLNDMVKSPDLAKALVEIIFKQAIHEPNFRYNGARLCSHLNNNLNISEPTSFRFFILEKCQFEYEQREALLRSDSQYLRGLVFFFGELYSQLLHPTGARIDILRNAIICLLETLLSDPNKDNVKSACQVIKLTGANIDDDEKLLSSEDRTRPEFKGLDKIFSQLGVSNVPNDLTSMVKNVIQLREIDWGRSSIPAETQPTLPPQVFPGGAVFYGPDGQPISTEEVLFLESQSYLDCRSVAPGCYINRDTYDDDLLNDEIAADYESFLREMGQ